MPAPLRIKLNEAEDETLKALSYAARVPRRTKARATALRMNAQGWNVPDIAEHLGWSQQTIRQTIERWRNRGLMGLWDAPRAGRHRRWSDEDWQIIEQAVQEPRRYSARQLSQKLFETRQVSLGQEQMRRILKKKLPLATLEICPRPCSYPSSPAIQTSQAIRLGVAQIMGTAWRDSAEVSR